jgi:hypothetical protein
LSNKQTKRNIMTSIQTLEKTFNKAVKSKMIALLPNATKTTKLHVAGVGYVFFYKDSEDNILGKTFRNKYGMQIYIN